MSATTMPLPDTAERWHEAADRAEAEHIQVEQDAASQWRASSGSIAGVWYALDVAGNLARGCECAAGTHDDPVCKHRAAFYRLIGALPTRAAPFSPAPAVTPIAKVHQQVKEAERALNRELYATKGDTRDARVQAALAELRRLRRRSNELAHEALQRARETCRPADDGPCGWCRGRGESYSDSHWSYQPCWFCEGTGRRIAQPVQV